jgi:hypothetical protein
MNTRGIAAVLLLSFLLGLGSPALAQNYAPESLDRYFRVEWQSLRSGGGALVEGYVYNLYGYTADRMMLRIDHLDDAGQVTGRTRAWIPGQVPQGSRAWFSIRVPPAPGYRVHVESFDWIGRGGA